jgi:hypothetical protein
MRISDRIHFQKAASGNFKQFLPTLPDAAVPNLTTGERTLWTTGSNFLGFTETNIAGATG